MSSELWKPIVGFEGIYEVSDRGRVRSVSRRGTDGRIRSGRLRKLSPKKSGHLQVDLWRGNTRSMRQVHQLVLEAFVGPRPDDCDGCHWDGDPSNNRLSNLRWDTKLGNFADQRRHGTHASTRRTHCKHGHPLRAPNLTPFSVRNGRRDCLACSRARTTVARHGGDVRTIADQYFELIETGRERMKKRRRNPAIHEYCFSCLGWGSTTVRKSTDYEDENDCIDCGGTGVRPQQKDES